jgi:hypothetical protein
MELRCTLSRHMRMKNKNPPRRFCPGGNCSACGDLYLSMVMVSNLHAMVETIPRSTLTWIAYGPDGDLAQRKVDYWRTTEVKNLKKIDNPQAFTVE